MNLPRRFAFILAVLLVAPAALWAEDGFSARYLVFSIDAAGKVKPLFYRAVLLADPLRSRTAEEMETLRQESSREEEGVEVQLLDGDGQIVFEDLLRVPQWVHGEFHEAKEAQGGWAIEAHRFPMDPQVFVVRVPTTGARLSLAFAGQHHAAVGTVTFDLNDLEGRKDLLPAALPLATGPTKTASVVTGSPGNRVDLLIMGDGYTSAQTGKFNSDTANVEAGFFTLTPYSEYKNYVNRVTLFTPSAQSGADHPPYNAACTGDNPSCCADPAAQSDPLAGTYVNTAFGGRFCAFNIHRLTGVDTAAVFAAASAYPDWDRILLLLNDATYGGAGGGISVVSTHSLAVDIARHEYGHSFTGLADEYDTPFPGFPNCSDISGPSCEPNVTDQTSRPLIKWSPWISASTPVPTPEGNPAYANVAGLFEGARYRSTGMYRHRDTECLMNFLGKPFGEVCSQEYVLRLYRGGWGAPSAGIDMIEPGTESPPEGSYHVLTGMNLSATLLGPEGGPPVSVTWKVNGVAVPGATGAAYNFQPTAPGTYQVALEARDTTSLVHPAMAGAFLQSSRSWTITSMEPLWVSVNGNDGNDCSQATPCRTFSAALARISPGGEIDVLDSGDFGPVTINKSVSLVSKGPLGGIQVSSGTAISINAGTNDKVVLRGLTLDGLGTGLNGISFVSGGSLYIENCTINGFGQFGIEFAPTNGSGRLFVTDTLLRNNGVGATGGGLHLIATTGPGFVATVDGLRSENNVFGLKAETLGVVTVRNSLAAGNGFSGFSAVTPAGSGSNALRMLIEDSFTTHNGTNGVVASGPGARVTISNVVVTNNQTGLNSGSSGSIVSFGNNKIHGNATDGAPSQTVLQQ